MKVILRWIINRSETLKGLVEDKIRKMPSSPQSHRSAINCALRLHLVVIGVKIDVDAELFKRVEPGDEVTLFYTKRANMLLRIEKTLNKNCD